MGGSELVSAYAIRHGIRVATVVSIAMAAPCSFAEAAGLPRPLPPGLAAGPDARPLERDARGKMQVANEVIVRFRASADEESRANARRGAEATREKKLLVPGAELLTVSRGAVEAAISALERRPDVLYAEPNHVSAMRSIPTDTKFSHQWAMNNTGQTITTPGGTTFGPGTPDADVDAVEAWNISRGSNQVTVAIADTGIAFDHPDLAPNIWNNSGETGTDSLGRDRRSNGVDDDGNGKVDDWRGWDFFQEDNTPQDIDDHGSMMASVAGARGNDLYGIAGINWQVKLMPLRVGDTNVGAAEAADSFAYAGQMGVKVVSASFGTVNSQLVSDSIAGAPNTLFFIASGNDGKNLDLEPDYPCSFNHSNIVCVGATDLNDALADFSNYGAQTVDLAAPGVFIIGAVPAYSTPLKEDFETALAGRWVTGGMNNTWARINIAAEGGWSLTDSPSGQYANNTNSWARTASRVDLTGKQDCRLLYSLRLDIENAPPTGGYYDALWIEGSSDGVTWQPVDYWVGSVPTSLRWATNLSVFDGQQVYLRFALETDGSVTRDGAYIDNVEVRCTESTYTGSEYRYGSGTSPATPLVAGTAALILAREPSTTTGALKNQILATVDKKASLTGKVLTGGRLNALRALAEYDFPESASPLTVSLVPDFRQTISPTQCSARSGLSSSHGPPDLPGGGNPDGSCNPPAFLPGTVAHFGSQTSATASLTAVPGNAATSTDEADVTVSVSATDVRSGSATGADYNPVAAGPDLTLSVKVRISDMLNGVSLDQPGTVEDRVVAVPVACATTTSGTVGSSCSANTTLDAITPATVREGKFSVFQTFRARLLDSGANGVRNDADDRSFAMQGIYVR
jgi:subtilisin family serine protease